VFGLPEDAYHNDPALGSSGLRHLMVSPLTFWADSRLNPDREESESDAKDYGRAYHKLILEGDDAFTSTYAEELDALDYPTHLKSGESLRKKCDELGLKKNGTNGEMAQRIRAKADEDGLEVFLWDEVVAEHAAANDGKIFLSKKLYRRALLAKRAILASYFMGMVSGGVPEVSLFWTDKRTGVKCKARLDYLRPNRITDLKTFSNSKGLPLLTAVGHSITNYRYLMQAVMYIDGLRNVMEAIDDERLGEAGKVIKYAMLFQESGHAPNVVARDIEAIGKSGENVYYSKAEMDYRFALNLYAKCAVKYGTSPWVDAKPRATLQDDDLPGYYFTS
jgi:hypothetical protein